MVINILKARIKVLLREKMFTFWGIVFPILLATFLYIEVTDQGSRQTMTESKSVVGSGSITIVRTFLDQEGKFDGIIYFLAIIAIACFISGFSGCREMEDCLCYISPKAVRINVVPVNFWMFFSCSLFISWSIANIYLTIIIIYFKSILGLHIEGPLVGWLLLISLSTLCGCLIDMLIGTMSKQSIPIKQGTIATLGVGGCILAGLINDKVKFYVDAYTPIISKINPASIMVDGMFTLCTYGMTAHFNTCILRLVIVDSICFGILLLMIARRRRE